MRESKPYWREVPKQIHLQIEEVLAGKIRRAIRVFGGYGPSATFRIEIPTFADRAAAVATAGIYAARAGKPPIPGHQRLREMQRLLLGPALRWACNLLGLPQPPVSKFVHAKQ